MFHVGKRAVWQVKTPVQPAGSPTVASAPEEFCSSSLIFLKYILSDHEFLVNSGASVLVFPGQFANILHPSLFLLPLRSKVYTWNFQLAPVAVPLLGADFLEHFNLLVDIKGWKVVHTDCPEDVAKPLPVLSQHSNRYPIFQLRKRFRNFWKSFVSKPCHNVRHHLLTNPSPPVFAKPRRLNPEKLAAAKDEFSKMDYPQIILSMVIYSTYG